MEPRLTVPRWAQANQQNMGVKAIARLIVFKRENFLCVRNRVVSSSAKLQGFTPPPLVNRVERHLFCGRLAGQVERNGFPSVWLRHLTRPHPFALKNLDCFQSARESGWFPQPPTSVLRKAARFAVVCLVCVGRFPKAWGEH